MLIEIKGKPITIIESAENKNIMQSYRYETEISELPAFIDYSFKENSLVSKTIILNTIYSDPNMYFADYDIIRATFIKEYGTPNNDNETWNNGLLGRMYKNDKGKALLNNAISRNTLWQDSSTVIIMEMHKDTNGSGVETFIRFFDLNYFKPGASISATPTPRQQNLFDTNSEVLMPKVGEWVNCGNKFKFMFYYSPIMTKSQSYITADGIFILCRVQIQNLTEQDYRGISGFELSKTDGDKTIRFPISTFDSWYTSNAWEIDKLGDKLEPYRTMDTYLVFDVNGSVEDDWILTFAPRDFLYGKGAVCSVKMKLPKISYEP